MDAAAIETYIVGRRVREVENVGAVCTGCDLETTVCFQSRWQLEPCMLNFLLYYRRFLIVCGCGNRSISTDAGLNLHGSGGVGVL